MIPGSLGGINNDNEGVDTVAGAQGSPSLRALYLLPAVPGSLVSNILVFPTQTLLLLLPGNPVNLPRLLSVQIPWLLAPLILALMPDLLHLLWLSPCTTTAISCPPPPTHTHTHTQHTTLIPHTPYTSHHTHTTTHTVSTFRPFPLDA